MKICWDNLNGLYLTVHGNFRKGNYSYLEKRCLNCNEAFLAKKYGNKTTNYCSHRCGARSQNHKTPLKQVNKKRKLKKICKEYEYYNSPKYCEICEGILTYEQAVIRKNKCCSNSCSTILKWNDPIYKDILVGKMHLAWAKKINYDIEKWKDYSKLTRKYTERNYRKFKDYINPNNLLRSKTDYNIDHRFSVLDGFINNIDPKIISHPGNLQMITAMENRDKSFNSSIDLKRLFKEIEAFGG